MKRGSSRRVVLAVLAVITLALLGCSSEVHFQIKPNGEEVEPVDFGEGIYFFYLTGSTYGSSLRAFMEKADSLVLIGTDAENDDRGLTVGHWVYFRKKDK